MFQNKNGDHGRSLLTNQTQIIVKTIVGNSCSAKEPIYKCKELNREYFRPIPHLSEYQKDLLFQNVVKKDSGCWEWTKFRNKAGYGMMRVGTSMHLTHRLAWGATHGPMERGLCVLHKCDNPACMNPDHLFLGTRYDNAQDCVMKNRQTRMKGESNGMAILTEKQVRLLRDMHLEFGAPQILLAKIANVTTTNMSSLLSGKTWRHV
jgi:hypothetical protein